MHTPLDPPVGVKKYPWTRRSILSGGSKNTWGSCLSGGFIHPGKGDIFDARRDANLEFFEKSPYGGSVLGRVASNTNRASSPEGERDILKKKEKPRYLPTDKSLLLNCFFFFFFFLLHW